MPNESDGNDMYIKVTNEIIESENEDHDLMTNPFSFLLFLPPAFCSDGGLKVLGTPATKKGTRRKTRPRGQDGFLLYFFHILLYYILYYTCQGIRAGRIR